MIKIYSMPTCPDCAYIDSQVANNNKYQVINIGQNVKFLKEFIKMRDTDKVFEECKLRETIGIPCFVLEDGTITLVPEEAGLQSRPISEGASCALDGSGC